jgi:hypothetical protein
MHPPLTITVTISIRLNKLDSTPVGQLLTQAVNNPAIHQVKLLTQAASNLLIRPINLLTQAVNNPAIQIFHHQVSMVKHRRTRSRRNHFMVCFKPIKSSLIYRQ